MYATKVSVRIEPGHEQEARSGLVNEVLPMVKSAPGFMAGYWFDAEAGHGESIVMWDTKEHADGAAARLQPGAHPAPGVTVENIQVREILEHI